MTKFYRDGEGNFLVGQRYLDYLVVAILKHTAITGSGLVIGFFIGREVGLHYQPTILSPLAPSSVVLVKPVLAEESKLKTWSGTASYYSRKGCLGCSKSFRMANGQILDNNKLTLACGLKSTCKNWKMGTVVEVKNQANGKTVKATVTDKGGLRPGRIADLSMATRDAIGCSNLCKVIISETK